LYDELCNLVSEQGLLRGNDFVPWNRIIVI
jgi:hypothetical protein